MRAALRSDLLGVGLDPGVDCAAVEQALLDQQTFQCLDAERGLRRQMSVEFAVNFRNPARFEACHVTLNIVQKRQVTMSVISNTGTKPTSPSVSTSDPRDLLCLFDILLPNMHRDGVINVCFGSKGDIRLADQ